MQLTSGKDGESQPRWSPDGASLAFVAKREGTEHAQIHLLPSGGGEARRLTNHETAADNPVWSSDPNAVAYSKASETLRPNGYAGPLGYASAATMADYVLVDMYAKAVTGQATPQEAMEEAEKRANRYYRV